MCVCVCVCVCVCIYVYVYIRVVHFCIEKNKVLFFHERFSFLVNYSVYQISEVVGYYSHCLCAIEIFDLLVSQHLLMFKYLL